MSVRSPKDALRALAAAMGWRVGKGNLLTRKSDGLTFRGRPTRKALALLADLALRRKDARALRASVGWTPGRLSTHGLSAHEEHATRWLASGDD